VNEICDVILTTFLAYTVQISVICSALYPFHVQ